MNPLKLKFLTEKYEKENRTLKLQDEFIALPGRLKPITCKFYAKHDVLSSDNPPEEFVNIVKRSAYSTPKDNYKYPPPTENMLYGWNSQTLIPRSLDKRFAFPLAHCDFIKTELYIRKMTKI